MEVGRKVLHKFGQVSIFIGLGVVLVALITVVIIQSDFLVEDTAQIVEETVPEEFIVVREYVDNCVYEAAKIGLERLGSTGGYIDPVEAGIETSYQSQTEGDGMQLFENSPPIAYWHYLVSPNTCERNCYFDTQRPELLGEDPYSIQTQLSAFISENVRACVNDFDSLKELGFDFEQLDFPTTQVLFQEDEVQVIYTHPLIVSQDNQETEITRFISRLDVPFMRLYEYAYIISEVQSQYRYLEGNAFELIMSLSGRDISKFPPIAGTTYDYANSLFWIKSLVEQNFMQTLSVYIPALTVLGSNNYVDYSAIPAVSNNELTRHIYERFELPIQSDDPELNARYTNFNVTHSYSLQPLFFNVNDGSTIIKPNSISTDFFGLLPFGAQTFDTVYDFSFPTMVTITDDEAFNNEGYTFQFALEANFRDNKPMFENYNKITLDQDVDLGYGRFRIETLAQQVNGGNYFAFAFYDEAQQRITRQSSEYAPAMYIDCATSGVCTVQNGAGSAVPIEFDRTTASVLFELAETNDGMTVNIMKKDRALSMVEGFDDNIAGHQSQNLDATLDLLNEFNEFNDALASGDSLSGFLDEDSLGEDQAIATLDVDCPDAYCVVQLRDTFGNTYYYELYPGVQQQTYVCDVDQRNAPANFQVVDKVTGAPVEGAGISYICGAQTCTLGLTDSQGELSSNLPVCLGGLLSVSKENYYKANAPVSTTVDQEVQIGDIELQPVIEINATAQKYLLVKELEVIGNRFPRTVLRWGTLRDTPTDLDVKEMSLIAYDKIDVGPYEDDFSGVVHVRGADNEYVTARLIPGIYEVTITNILFDDIVIPRYSKKISKSPFGSETIWLGPVDFQGTYPSGFLELNEETFYMEVTEEDLQKDLVTFYAIAPDIPGMLRDPSIKVVIEDLEINEEINTYANRHRDRIRPVFSEVSP